MDTNRVEPDHRLPRSFRSFCNRMLHELKVATMLNSAALRELCVKDGVWLRSFAKVHRFVFLCFAFESTITLMTILAALRKLLAAKIKTRGLSNRKRRSIVWVSVRCSTNAEKHMECFSAVSLQTNSVRGSIFQYFYDLEYSSDFIKF